MINVHNLCTFHTQVPPRYTAKNSLLETVLARFHLQTVSYIVEADLNLAFSLCCSHVM